MKLIPFTLIATVFLLSASVCFAEEESVEAIYNDLLAICSEHPEFSAQTIDIFDPSSAKEFEKNFYNKAAQLHKLGALSFIVDKRQPGKDPDAIKCIDNILSTWPG